MNKKNKLFVILVAVSLLASCGKGGGGKNDSSDTTEANPIDSKCKSFKRSDSFEVIAIKANKARVECGLSEDEILAQEPL